MNTPNKLTIARMIIVPFLVIFLLTGWGGEANRYMIGAHPGDKVEVTVVFPDDYQAADLAGKEAVFDVTVNGIYE